METQIRSSKTILIVLLFWASTQSSLFADPNSEALSKTLNAEELLRMPTDKAFAAVQKISKEDSKVLISQIRSIAKKEYAHSENFYLLISHLESIRAIEEEQSRLRSLNWVYALGFFLFTGFLVYIWNRERKFLREWKKWKQ